MLIAETTGKCPECDGRVIDAQEELVCTGCGMVTAKEVIDSLRSGPLQAIDFTGQGIGGYLGSADPSVEERRTTGLSGTRSNYRYLKQVSDCTGRDDNMLYSCARLIERVCDRLMLPKVIMADSVLMARKLLTGPVREKTSSAVVSAYSIILACKTLRNAQVGVREILAAHGEQGRRVKMSDIIQMNLEVPVSRVPRRPVECTARLMVRLFSAPESQAGEGVSRVCRPSYLVNLRRRAGEVLEEADELLTEGHNPWALAATAIYAAEATLAAEEQRRLRLTQKRVAEAAGVAEYTVREQFRVIFKELVQARIRARPEIQIALAR